MILGNMFLTILQPSQLRSLNCHSFAGSIAGSVTRSAKRRLLLQLGCNPDQTVIPTLVQQKLIRWNTVNLSCLVDRWLCRYACKKSPSMLDELKSWMKFELWGWRNDKMSKRHNQQRCLSISWTKYVNCCIWSYRNLTDTNRPYFFSRHFTNAILEVPPHTLLDVLNIKIFHLCIFCQSGRALQYQPMETIYMIRESCFSVFFNSFLLNIWKSWSLLCLPGFGARNSQRFTPLYRGNGLFERSHIWTGSTKTCKSFKVWNPQIPSNPLFWKGSLLAHGRGRVWGANLWEWFSVPFVTTALLDLCRSCEATSNSV